MLKTKVKASCVTNLTDARYFAAREVEWLGFPLGAGTEGAITLSVAKSIADWVDGVKIVGEFDFPTAEELLAAQQYLNLDAVQVGMMTPKDVLALIDETTIIQVVEAGAGFKREQINSHLVQYSDCCDIFLLDFTKSGITCDDLLDNLPYPVDFVVQICSTYKVIIAANGDAYSLDALINTFRPYGISLKGGAEEKTGYKSFDELDDILSALEIND